MYMYNETNCGDLEHCEMNDLFIVSHIPLGVFYWSES